MEIILVFYLLIFFYSLLSAVCLLAALYLLTLTLAAWAGAAASPRRGEKKTRFVLVVPAHDRAETIGATVRRLKAIDYPSGGFEVTVAAYNCTDDTAGQARKAGARVFERNDDHPRSRDFAVDAAWRELLEYKPHFHALVLIEEDSQVSSNFLAEMDALITSGSHAVQAHCELPNPLESWTAAFQAACRALTHGLLPLGRSTLQLSAGLAGNGMCFSRQVAERFGWNDGSAEGLRAFTYRLGLDGIRVAFAPRAKVGSRSIEELPGTAGPSSRRGNLRRQWLSPLFSHGIAGRDAVCLDLAADLLLPPLGFLGAVALLLGGAGLGIHLLFAPGVLLPFLCGIPLVLLGICWMSALLLQKAPLKMYGALFLAPVLLLAKLRVRPLLVHRGASAVWRHTGGPKA